MRRQIVIIMCVAVVSFLFGTLVSMGLTANGIMPNPFDNKVSETSELQARIDSLNASLVELQKRMPMKIVRFFEPDEINITNVSRLMDNVTSFVWTPNSPANSSILAVYCSFEFCFRNWTQFAEVTLLTDIYTNGFDSADCKTERFYKPLTGETYDWMLVCFRANEGVTSWIKPNQESYTIVFRTCALAFDFPVPQTYARNINIIMEVING